MKNILSVLIDNLVNGEKSFVFPSQVAADFWRRKILDSGAVSAVRWERFQSWDSFKEELFALNRRELPANSRIRRIFASDLIKRFAAGECDFLLLLNPDFRETSGIFQGSISGLLPHLQGFLKLTETKRTGIDPLYLQDMNLLYSEYLTFMERFDLFDPSWVTPEMGGDRAGRIIFFPELIEDWDELAPQLESGAGIEIIPLSDGFSAKASPNLNRFATSREEIEAFCLKAGALLDEGETDIAVTLTDADLMPLLKETALLYGIPLNFHLGSNLGETKEGMFFSRLRECRDESFSLRSLKGLLLNGAFPWKDKDLLRELIGFGAETHCLRNIDSSREGDLWSRMLFLRGKAYREDGALQKLYSELKLSILGLTAAAGFADFSRLLEVFLTRFMDTDAWAPEGLAVFQRCRRSIAELKGLEEKFGGLKMPSPLDFLIQDLGGITYVAQRSGGGIPVYAYRVSAGILPAHHFILGLSHADSRVISPPYPFLREDQRVGLDLEEKDFSDDFIQAYLSSGETVAPSFSDQTRGGPRLAAGFFVVHNLIEEGAAPASDPFLRELAFWRGEAGLPAALPPVQSEGAGAALGIFRPRAFDMNGRPFGPEEFRQEALLPLRKEHEPEESFMLSPYRLDDWASCPLKYYLKYSLKLGEIAYEAEWGDPMALGNLRHEILGRFFEKLGYRKFDPSAGEEYRGLMEEASAAVFAEWEKREPLGSTPFWFVFRKQIHKEVLAFLEAEGKLFPGFGVVEMEKSHELRVGDVYLSGRIDRVSEKDGKIGVIDYKSSVYQPLSSMIDSEGTPFSYQMPIYILFLRGEEREVASAAYYDMKKGKYVCMLDPLKPLTAEKMEEALEVLTEQLQRFQAEAEAGSFYPEEDCRPCDFRFICRTKYVIREADRG